MLIALISARGEDVDEAGQALVERAIAGGSIIQRQARLALQLGCQKIVCLALEPRNALISLQHLVERAGAEFILARSHRILAGCVSTADRIFVMAEGLVVDPALGTEWLGGKCSIVSLPADPAIAAGFERIDRAHAWGGAMVLRGDLVEKLHELPDDVDCISSLLRLGLQAKTPLVPLASGVLHEAKWGLVTNSAQLADWNRLSAAGLLSPSKWSQPIEAAIDRLTLQSVLGQRLSPQAATWGVLAAGLLLFVGFAGAALGLPVLALACVVIGLMLARASDALRRLGGQTPSAELDFRSPLRWITLAGDGAMALALVIAAPEAARIDTGFAVAMLLGLLHFIGLAGSGYMVPLLADRAALGLLLCGAIFFYPIQPLIQILAMVSLVFGLFLVIRARLTRA